MKTHIRKLLINAAERTLTIRVAMKKNISIQYCTVAKDGELVLSYKVLFWDDFPRVMFTEKELESIKRFAHKGKEDFDIEVIKAVEGREGLTREEIMNLLPEEEENMLPESFLLDGEEDELDFAEDVDDWGLDE